MAHEQAPSLALPVSVVGRVDIGRLLREAELIDEFLNQSAIREPGTPVKLPKTSRLMDETIQANQLNVLHEEERHQLLEFLRAIKEHAPVIHISFSADPPPSFTDKLMTWLRREIHPYLLMQVGLQPNIGAGAIVRTTNQYFDFSLRQTFIEKKNVLIDMLTAGVQKTPEPETTSSAQPVNSPQAPPPAATTAEPAAPPQETRP